jgi:hypothetical protein
MTEMTDTYVRNAAGKFHLGRSKLDVKETGYEGAEWIELALDVVQYPSLLNTVMT